MESPGYCMSKIINKLVNALRVHCMWHFNRNLHDWTNGAWKPIKNKWGFCMVTLDISGLSLYALYNCAYVHIRAIVQVISPVGLNL